MVKTSSDVKLLRSNAVAEPPGFQDCMGPAIINGVLGAPIPQRVT